MSGSGTGDLMDAILEALPAETSAQYEDDLPRITIAVSYTHLSICR